MFIQNQLQLPAQNILIRYYTIKHLVKKRLDNKL